MITLVNTSMVYTQFHPGQIVIL